MINVRFLFQMPSSTGYFGGIAFILGEYIKRNDKFSAYGINTKLWDYPDCSGRFKNGFLAKISSLVQQKEYLKHMIANENPDIYHIHTSRGWTMFKDMVLARYIKKTQNKKTVITIHFAEADKILSRIMPIKQFELHVMKKYLDRIVFLSEETREQFISYGIKRNNTEVLYTFHTFDCSQTTHICNDTKMRLLFMGSIDKRKGIIDLLQAFSAIDNPEIELHICGKITEDDVKEEFQHYLKTMASHVIFHGYISGSEKEKLLEEADVLVLPSYGEGMPIVIMEAMAKKTAIISTDVGAIPEIIGSENGYIIKPGDIQELRNRILYLYNNRDVLIAMKEQNCKEAIKYGVNYHIKCLTDIYKTMRA